MPRWLSGETLSRAVPDRSVFALSWRRVVFHISGALAPPDGLARKSARPRASSGPSTSSADLLIVTPNTFFRGRFTVSTTFYAALGYAAPTPPPQGIACGKMEFSRPRVSAWRTYSRSLRPAATSAQPTTDRFSPITPTHAFGTKTEPAPVPALGTRWPPDTKTERTHKR